MSDLLFGAIEINNAKNYLMPKAWHPRRWLDWCMPEDEKKEIKQFLTDEK